MINNKNHKTMNKNEEKMANGLSMSEIYEVVSDQMEGYSGNDGMSITKLVKMLAGAITARKEEYEINFVKDGGIWYIDVPNWPWKRDNLAMVAGADKMMDLLANSPQNDKGANHVRLRIKPASEQVDPDTLQQLLDDDWVELAQIDSSLTGGATYTAKGHAMEGFYRVDPWSGEHLSRTLWLCPVTLFVFGQYPKYFYGKVI